MGWTNKLKVPSDNERIIIREILKRAFAYGCTAAVSYDAGYDIDELVYTSDIDKVMKDIQACDEEHIFILRKDWKNPGYIYVIYGNGNNGLDVVSDYTIKLSPYVDTVLDDIREFEKSKGRFNV